MVRSNRNLVSCCFLCHVGIKQATQNSGDQFRKNMAFSEGNQLFAGDFHAVLDEITADTPQFTKKWNCK